MRGGPRTDPAMDWKFVERVRDFWKGKFMIKGIDTHEDAKLCLDHGLDGILVSNHGGRSTETGRGTLEALPEVVAAVNGRIPVFVDGGVRRVLLLGVGEGKDTEWRKAGGALTAKLLTSASAAAAPSSALTALLPSKTSIGRWSG